MLPFPESTRRPKLLEQLCVYLKLLAETGVKAEIWLDGSFTTEKIEPDDVDMVVVYDPVSVNAMPHSARLGFKTLLNTNIAKTRYDIHVFAVDDRDRDGKAYWRGFFGFMRDERTPKGIATIGVNQ